MKPVDAETMESTMQDAPARTAIAPKMPPPRNMAFVDRFSMSIRTSGIAIIATWGHVPGENATAARMAGPALAMSLDDAKALAYMIQKHIDHAERIATQASHPN
jgi:hypothetical protein